MESCCRDCGAVMHFVPFTLGVLLPNGYSDGVDKEVVGVPRVNSNSLAKLRMFDEKRPRFGRASLVSVLE